MSSFKDRVQRILDLIECEPYRFKFYELSGGQGFLVAQLYRPDTHTGRMGWGEGGPEFITGAMSDDTIAKRTFVAAIKYSEHEVREAWKYKGKRVLGPHVPLDTLVEVLDE